MAAVENLPQPHEEEEEEEQPKWYQATLSQDIKPWPFHLVEYDIMDPIIFFEGKNLVMHVPDEEKPAVFGFTKSTRAPLSDLRRKLTSGELTEENIRHLEHLARQFYDRNGMLVREDDDEAVRHEKAMDSALVDSFAQQFMDWYLDQMNIDDPEKRPPGLEPCMYVVDKIALLDPSEPQPDTKEIGFAIYPQHPSEEIETIQEEEEVEQ